MTTSLKQTLQHDLTESIRARDAVRSATLRMALTAVTTAETAGTTHRTLSDAEVLQVLTKEAKKRKEASVAFTGAGRAELAAKEDAELVVLEGYLPAALTPDELAQLVAEAIAETGASAPGQMGQVMKVLQPQTTGRADGAAVAAAVRAALAAH